MSRDDCRRYAQARGANAAWGLLASPRAPLILGALKSLFDDRESELLWEDAVQRLGEAYLMEANSEIYELPENELPQVARRDLRSWLKRGLVVERDGRLLATDALQKAFQFVDGLEERTMTSTASRLATVQREIESLETKLNPARSERAAHLRKRIADLENELERVERGEFEVLGGARAVEGIREVYQLAVSLRADFRRVEDSYREADRQLRQEIVRSDQDRGGVLDRLLDGHDALLETAEGQVFDGFHEQLVRTVELDEMKARLRAILSNESAGEALGLKQRNELRWLVHGLVRESERVIQARARGERDVRGFIKLGLASEHHRVGALLNEILDAATEVDWSSQAVRRTPGPLPPVALAVPFLPLVQRLRFKEAAGDGMEDLDLHERTTSTDEVDPALAQALAALDRGALLQSTVDFLNANGGRHTLGDMARSLPPSHDLEALAFWIGLAREAGADFGSEREGVEITDRDEVPTRFELPRVSLDSEMVATVDPERLG